MPSPGIEPLTTILCEFIDAHPAMSVTVDAAFTPNEVVHAVKSGQAEVGLLGSASAPNTSGLHVLPIEDQPLVLISPRADGASANPEVVDLAGGMEGPRTGRPGRMR